MNLCLIILQITIQIMRIVFSQAIAGSNTHFDTKAHVSNCIGVRNCLGVRKMFWVPN